MTRITFYPIEPFRPDKEAIHVTASASPQEAFAHTSLLGMSLYGAADALNIRTYPGPHDGVVFEGDIETIDEKRHKLKKLSPEIAKRAIAKCESGKGLSLKTLQEMVSSFGRPIMRVGVVDNFSNRMQQSVAEFADETTWDGCLVHIRNTPYRAPLDVLGRELAEAMKLRDLKSIQDILDKTVLPLDQKGFFESLLRADHSSPTP